MYKNLLVIFSFLLLISCNEVSTNIIKAENIQQLNSAINEAQPGDEIVLANGVWKDVEIEFIGNGTKENPITIKAETAGEVFIEGVSNLKFGGEYLVVDGLFLEMDIHLQRMLLLLE